MFIHSVHARGSTLWIVLKLQKTTWPAKRSGIPAATRCARTRAAWRACAGVAAAAASNSPAAAGSSCGGSRTNVVSQLSSGTVRLYSFDW